MNIYITTSTTLGLTANYQNSTSAVANQYDMVFVLSETSLDYSDSSDKTLFVNGNHEYCRENIWVLQVLSVNNYEDIFWGKTVSSATNGVLYYLGEDLYGINFVTTLTTKKEKDILIYLKESLSRLGNFVTIDIKQV